MGLTLPFSPGQEERENQGSPWPFLCPRQLAISLRYSYVLSWAFINLELFLWKEEGDQVHCTHCTDQETDACLVNYPILGPWGLAKQGSLSFPGVVACKEAPGHSSDAVHPC